MRDIVSPITIKASAGTGKTYQLVRYFLALLLRGEDPKKVLATTFTRKAASEIQERVFLILAQSLLENKSALDIAEQFKLSLPRVSLEEALIRISTLQDRLSICTLDSFFGKVLRCFSLDSSLSPLWKIKEENLEDSGDTLLLNFLDLLGKDEDFTFLTHLIQKGAVRSINAALSRIINDIYKVFLEVPEEGWSLEKKELSTRFSMESVLMRVKTAAAKIKHKRAVEALKKAIEDIKAYNFSGALTKGVLGAVIKGNETYYNKAIPAEAQTAAWDIFNYYASNKFGELNRHLSSLYHLLRKYHHYYLAVNYSEGILSFEDVKWFLFREKILGNLEEVYYRLDCAFSHILLDEFQDTSRLEWWLLMPIVEEVLSKAGQENIFLCVGDLKQAIYGWRGGASDILRDIPKIWTYVKEEQLTKSWRSAKAVIEFVNYFFSALSSSQVLSAYSTAISKWGRYFSPHSTAVGEEGYVGIYFAENKDNENTAPLEKVIPLIKDIISSLSPSSLSIAVLCRKNETASQIMYELLKAGIQCTSGGSSPLSSSYIVAAILQFLKALEHPNDSIAFHHVKKSLLGKVLDIKDQEKAFNSDAQILNFKKEIKIKGLERFLNGIYEELLRLGITEQESLKVLSLIRLAGKWHRANSSYTLCDFVNFVKKSPIKEEGGGNIEVTTIHQAKGLEFDVVILPELFFKLNASLPSYLVKRKSSAQKGEKVIPRPDNILRYASKEIDNVINDYQQRQFLEELSVFYVAVTRAKYALYILLSDNPRGNVLNWTKVVRELAGSAQGQERTLIKSWGDSFWFKKISSLVKEDKKEKRARVALKNLFRDFKEKRKGIYLLDEVLPSQLNAVENPFLFLEKAKVGGKAEIKGEAIHLLLAKVFWIEKLDVNFSELNKIGCLTTSDLTEIEERMRKFLNSSLARKYLSKDYYLRKGAEKIEVFTEYPFLGEKDGKLVKGRYDRVVLYTIGGRRKVDIFDFKSGQEEVTFYLPQMKLYKDTASDVFFCAKEDIKTYLIFVDTGQINEV